MASPAVPEQLEMLTSLASLLSAECCEVKGFAEPAVSERVQSYFQNSGGIVDLRDKSTATTTVKSLCLTCPSLALKHKTHSATHPNDRKQTEDYALSLLDRPLVLSRGYSLTCQDFSNLGKVLLKNVYESFKVLVDSRLHAYATFLARHGLALLRKNENTSPSILSLEQKIKVLLELGDHVNVRSISTQFKASNDNNNNATTTTHGVVARDDGLASLAIDFVVLMEIVVPGKSLEVLPVAIKVPGEVFSAHNLCRDDEHSGKDDISLSYHVKVDTAAFLSTMMKHAAHVASLVVDTTNMIFSIPEIGSVADTAAVDNFTEYEDQAHKLRHGHLQGLELLSTTAAVMPGVVVSPEITSCQSPVSSVPDLYSEADVDSLSPDQCADIVDGMFSEFDSPVFTYSATTVQAECMDESL